MKKLTLYIALALTHVKSEEERDDVRGILAWIRDTFDVEILQWAYDPAKWEPKDVPSIYLYDSQRVLCADLMMVLFLSSEGSDGRGAEVQKRCEQGLPIIAAAKTGVKVSRYSKDCLGHFGVEIVGFESFFELHGVIAAALEAIASRQKQASAGQGDLFGEVFPQAATEMLGFERNDPLYSRIQVFHPAHDS